MRFIDSPCIVIYTGHMKKNAHMTTRDFVLMGLFAAILAVLSQVAIPMPSGVPVTLQTFAIALCGFVLGTRKGTIAVLIYLAMGALGIPVFANFSGGLHVFAGPTGGFLFGFIPLVALCGIVNPAFAAIGLLACHFLGALQYALVTGVSFFWAVLNVSAPYLLKDAIVFAAAFIIARTVRSRLQVIIKMPG